MPLFSILFEHKSYVPAHPWLQLLKYLVNSFQAQEREEEFTGLFRPVLPIVVYHVEQKWKQKPVQDYFLMESEDVFPFPPTFEYLLTDLSQYSEQEILEMEGNWIKRVFLALKVSRQQRAFSWLKDLLNGLDLTVENHRSSNFVQWIIVYLFKTGSSKEEFMEAMNQLNTSQKKQTLSLYDQLLLEAEETGMQKGLQKGIQKGIQRGSLLAQFQAFKNGLNMGHEPDSIALLIGIEPSLAAEWEALLRNDPKAELPEVDPLT